eukprot:2121823-Amphidinium_carterae.1
MALTPPISEALLFVVRWLQCLPFLLSFFFASSHDKGRLARSKKETIVDRRFQSCVTRSAKMVGIPSTKNCRRKLAFGWRHP